MISTISNTYSIVSANKKLIIEKIKQGYSRREIGNLLGLSEVSFNIGINMVGIDFYTIANEQFQKDYDRIHNKLIDDNFDYLLNCVIDGTPIEIVANKLHVSTSQLRKAALPYGLELGLDKNKEKAKAVKKDPSEKGSIGEQTVRRILSANNIRFKEQFTFFDCRFKDTNALARFDFAVLDQLGRVLYLIEYDGSQHTRVVQQWGGVEGLKKRQEHDVRKNEYCKVNNIPLIRIPYTVNLAYLSAKDLVPSTSRYLLH